MPGLLPEPVDSERQLKTLLPVARRAQLPAESAVEGLSFTSSKLLDFVTSTSASAGGCLKIS